MYNNQNIESYVSVIKNTSKITNVQKVAGFYAANEVRLPEGIEKNDEAWLQAVESLLYTVESFHVDDVREIVRDNLNGIYL